MGSAGFPKLIVPPDFVPCSSFFWTSLIYTPQDIRTGGANMLSSYLDHPFWAIHNCFFKLVASYWRQFIHRKVKTKDQRFFFPAFQMKLLIVSHFTLRIFPVGMINYMIT